MATTKIEWADLVWNPITGCSPVSEGCINCYAARMAKWLAGRFGYPKDDPFKVTVHEDRFTEPFYQLAPTRYFVCSMGDLFHPDVPLNAFHSIMEVMKQVKRHTFLLLTKRHHVAFERMKWFYSQGFNSFYCIVPNIWVGVSVENQEQAELRIPRLLHINAAKKFISVEPMLDRIEIVGYLVGELKLDWVICGGETGPGARPLQLDWVRSLRDQCSASNTPFFFKQWGPNKKAGYLIDGQ